MKPASYQLISARGTGSALVEAMLAYKGVPYTLKEVDYEKDVLGETETVVGLNPVAELPILILPNGETMTESAAIALHLEETFPHAPALTLSPTHPERAQFLRRLVFIVASLYPTFTYGDDPSDWVSTPAAIPELKQSTDARRKQLWTWLEQELGDGPYWFGETFTVLDLYVYVMTHWGPGRKWFDANAPKLTAIARHVHGIPSLREVWARNWPEPSPS